jgi:hypothetical protein
VARERMGHFYKFYFILLWSYVIDQGDYPILGRFLRLDNSPADTAAEHGRGGVERPRSIALLTRPHETSSNLAI